MPHEHLLLTGLAHRAKGSWGYPSNWMAEWIPKLTISAKYIAKHLGEVAIDDAAQIVGMCSLENHGEYFQLEHVWIGYAAWAQVHAGKKKTTARGFASRIP